MIFEIYMIYHTTMYLNISQKVIHSCSKPLVRLNQSQSVHDIQMADHGGQGLFWKMKCREMERSCGFCEDSKK